jgi:hypothetical protein
VARVLVAGAVANKPRSGGEAWVRLSWVRGLRALGCEVWFAEELAEPSPEGVATFRAAMGRLGDGVPAALLGAGVGPSYDEVLAFAREADLLVNISGHLRDPALVAAPRRRAYVDVDPGFTQLWARQGADLGLERHDSFFTVGENVGAADCTIPTDGIDWRPLPPPVTLEDWPVTAAPGAPRFTTVTSWRSALGTLTDGARTFPGKHHQWRALLDLPRRSAHAFELALALHPADAADAQALGAAGWRVRDPVEAAGDPEAFRAYVQGSAAELSVAHGAYVETNSGWISDRTVRYLASGRPAVVQDTGTRHPVGEGLLTFRTVEEAAAAADRVAADPEGHAQAARALAEERFAADRVLPAFLEQAGVP